MMMQFSNTNSSNGQDWLSENMEILTNKDSCAKINESAVRAADSFLVTDIRQNVHNENRVNIFLNNKFEFSLDISQVIDFGLKIGKSLKKDEVKKLRNASEFGKLYQRTLEWALARPRSIKETRDHLKQKKSHREFDNKCRTEMREYKKEHKDENPWKNPDNLDENGHLKFKNSPWAKNTDELPEISDQNIKAVIERLIERGYLDDAKFAKFYIENRFVKKGISERRLRQELQQKGVSKIDIENAFSAVPRSDAEEIKKIIAKKRKKYDDHKLINYLVRQGFEFQLVQSLVHEKDLQN